MQGPDPRLSPSPLSRGGSWRRKPRIHHRSQEAANTPHTREEEGVLWCEKAPAGLAASKPERGQGCWGRGRTGRGSGPSPSRAHPTSLTPLFQHPGTAPCGVRVAVKRRLEPGCQGERGNAQMLEQGGGQAGRAPGKGVGEAGCTPAGLGARGAAQSYKAEKCPTRHGGISGSSPAKCHPAGVAGGA